MRSLTTRFFVGLVLVSATALALGTWWVQRTVTQQFGRQVVVEQTREVVNGEVVERETRREIPGEGPVVTEELRGIDVALLNRRLIIAFSVIVIGAAVVTALLARRVLGPVHALRLAVDQMAAGTSTARVSVTGDDELAALGRAFNSMADALAGQEQLKRDLTNDIAHELRTPLTDLRCHIEALQDQVVDVTPDTLAMLHAEVSHLQRLVEDLGELARAEARQLPLEPESVVVAEVVHHLVKQAAPRAGALGVLIVTDAVDAAACAWVDRGRLQQVIGNLLDNALVHTPPAGTIGIGVEVRPQGVAVSVRDSGPGIPPDHLPHIFDRFYRVDASRSRTTGGVGLGLAIARQFVEASGGVIAVDSPATGGTVFTVTLPTGTRPM
ncbi:MAG: HAMP domain-containing protein [Acidobacteria bacterium]|nr:HAMP domain-containing protein [Acidobacteriota bacterium]